MPNKPTATHARAAAANAAAIAAVLATTAACGGGGEAGGQAGAGASPTDSPAPSSSPSPSPSGSPTEQALPEPEDGTDLASCTDAECEVRVSEGDEIPLGGTSGLDRLVVSEVGSDRVGFAIYAPGHQLGAFELGAPFSEDQAASRVNGMQVYIYGADEDGAVIRLAQQ